MHLRGQFWSSQTVPLVYKNCIPGTNIKTQKYPMKVEAWYWCEVFVADYTTNDDFCLKLPWKQKQPLLKLSYSYICCTANTAYCGK